MKRHLILGAVVLSVLLALGSALGEEEEQDKGGKIARPARGPRAVADANEPKAAARRAWRRGNPLEARISRLEEIRKIAEEEGAKRTVAALDKLIAEEKERFDRVLRRREQWRGRAAEGTKAKGKGRGRGGPKPSEAEGE